MLYVLGFDLSLTAPAAVALPADWLPGDWASVRSWTARPEPPASDDDVGQMRRYLEIADWVENIFRHLYQWGGAVQRACVEDYAFSRNISSTTRLRESGGIVKARVWEKCHGILLQRVSVSEARKLTFGFNPRRPKHDPKVVVQDAVINKFGAPKEWSEDICDAYVIAQYALSEVGGRIMSLAE